MTNAAERIVEKYRAVTWLDEEQVKALICNKAEKCEFAETCTISRARKDYLWKLGEKLYVTIETSGKWKKVKG